MGVTPRRGERLGIERGRGGSCQGPGRRLAALRAQLLDMRGLGAWAVRWSEPRSRSLSAMTCSNRVRASASPPGRLVKGVTVFGAEEPQLAMLLEGGVGRGSSSRASASTCSAMPEE